DLWLKQTGGSFVLSTYQSGHIIFLGSDENGNPYFIDRAVGTAMGLAIDKEKLWIGTREQIWRFSNVGEQTLNGTGYQATYMPRTCYMVGNSNTHDVLADVNFRGQHYDFLYANTQFSCIATLDPHYSFVPIWQPDFISKLAPEDRCHLNGIGARDGQLRYATFCGKTDSSLGWKEKQTGTGFIVDLESEEVVCEGLSMPHSPRWHDGKLWVLNSGEGELGYVDFEKRCFVPIAFCTGFARGLCFVNNMAVVGLSRLRPSKNGLLPGINLSARLEERNSYQRCGLQLFNLETGKLAHWVTIEGPITELYDVAFLSGIAAPYSPGFREPDLHRHLTNLPDTTQPQS
ncbi:TIGR03032 family protein, partial [Oceanospirillum beijerinckii]|uniref:TIGR03032 family protein n=1 Tax=Oceanospirillum beijerinckii TaxID=64976 RepID=UPI00056C24BD